MNKKKCPKCGEENPAEAVMCWACYTPLAGAAAVGAAAGASASGAAGATTVDVGATGEKKQIPPWQLGVVGIGLLAALYVGVKAVMPASESADDESGVPADAAPPPDDAGAAPAPEPAAPTASNPVVFSSNGEATVMPDKAPFTIVVPPNPKLSVATMAIVPTEESTSGPQAAALAAYTRRQYTASVGSWGTFYIYVFSDAKSAQYFADYQKRRRGAPLDQSDYSQLTNLWSSCLARYEYSATGGGRRIERVLYPSKNPGSWWYSRN